MLKTRNKIDIIRDRKQIKRHKKEIKLKTAFYRKKRKVKKRPNKDIQDRNKTVFYRQGLHLYWSQKAHYTVAQLDFRVSKKARYVF